MGELLIKPYEISVWEDKLTQNGFEETKLAVIGSNTMGGPNKVYDPVFNKKTNGEKILTFSLKYKYFDPYSENAEVINSFAALLANERKVKLKYGKDEEGKDQWYEFIIKDHTESSDGLTWTYTCSDAFVLELSKNGYNIEFSSDLNNNQGTAKEFAKKTLQDTDWRLGGADNFKQLIEEPIYKATLTSKTGVEIINATGDEKEVPDAGAQVYVFYSYIKNQNGKFVQFISQEESTYTIDDKNVITATNYRITTDLVFRDNGFYLDEAATPILSLGEVETKYHANRLAYGQLTTYDPVMEKTVERFKIGEGGDREVYKYTDYTYTTSTVVMNYITNGDNFNALEDGTLQGWNPYTDVEEGYSVNKLSLVTRPELGTNKKLADVSTLSQIEGFLEVKFNGPRLIEEEKIYNTVYNSGFTDSASFIDSVSAGDQFVLRWRAGEGEIDSLTPYNRLRGFVAKYEQDEPTRFGYYYKHINPNDIIVEFEGTPEILNNYVEGGVLQKQIDEGTGEESNKFEYVIDGVVQSPSTKYIYKDKETNKEYVWNGETGDFIEYNDGDNSYLPYYYLTGTADRAISPKELRNPEDKKKIGIFLYTTDARKTEEVTITEIVEEEETEEQEPIKVYEIDYSFEPQPSSTFSFVCNNVTIQNISVDEDYTEDIPENSSFEYNAKKHSIHFESMSSEITSFTVVYTKVEPIVVYIQDIQLTRFIPDANEKPVLIGNLPTATSNPVDHYYIKPDDGAKAEDIDVYTDSQELLKAIGSSESLNPLYNDTSEKNLSISVSQSNCFNILQTIAETFECWVDLVVEHDARGGIMTDSDGRPRKFVYLKEYSGKDNCAGFKYAINLESIERNINSDEIVTKLIVDQSQSEYVDEGYISIANAPSNPTGESYILNFDYYYNQGLLDRELTETDINDLTKKISNWNNQIKEKETQRREWEDALLKVASNRTVYTELVDSAKETKSEALGDFEELTGYTYDDYRALHNDVLTEPVQGETPEEAAEREGKQLTEEETILELFGKIYTASATINNYGGLLSNVEQEYWRLKHDLEGYESYNIKVWVDIDELNERHVIVDFSDYLAGVHFHVGATERETTVSKKYFDILTNETTITFDTLPENYTIDIAEATINDNKINKFRITSTVADAKPGIISEINDLIDEKAEEIKAFNNKYRRFIQEGTWNSTDYIDSELYYLDALQVSNTSAQPVASYTINVVEISQLEGFEWYIFDAGDKTYVEDTEFFGWANKNGILTPAREEVIVSEVEWHLDDPSQNVITVQNYKTRFEDLFQRISAAVQTVQYNEATYAKISSLMDADGTINQDVLLTSLNRISGQTYNLTSDGSIIINGENILIRNLTNAANCVILNNEGLRISSDGGNTWKTAISGRGIDAGAVYTGQLSTDKIIIGNEQNPSFRWDKSGISAYKSNGESVDTEGNPITVYDLQTYVRYDEYGLYGIKDGGSFKANSLEDVLDKAHFAVTWDGFFIKNSYEGGGQVSITSDNDFQVLQSGGSEKIKIGALEWLDNQGNTTTNPSEGVGAPTLYGIRIKNNAGDTVLRTGDDGNLEITGKITANSGHIGGMEVDNQRLKMKYIIFEPNKGIYSTYPNELGKTPVDPSVTVPPFIISDIDGSATFNNVIVRGSIKTSVFEYEEIQAIGGAFLFRPSSTIRQATVNGTDLDLVVEKGGLFKVGDWLKISNFSSEAITDEVTPDELNGFGLTYIYPVKAANGTHLTLDGAAALLAEQGLSTEDLVGGSVIDFGRHATQQVEVDGETSVIDVPGSNNYGIGINSSDGFINLPPRAISLFETVIHPNQDPKVSYRFRGILGTLPDPLESNINVRSSIYPYMQGKQGIYTDNMYIGDKDQYIAFYEDNNGDKHLKISAKEMVFEYDPDTGEEITWQDKIEDATQGADGEDAITVRIDSSAGTVFLNKQISTTLTCTVIKGNGTDITNQVTKFTWSKKNADGTIDASWNRALAGNTIVLTEADVTSKAIFTCEVEF